MIETIGKKAINPNVQKARSPEDQKSRWPGRPEVQKFKDQKSKGQKSGWPEVQMSLLLAKMRGAQSPDGQKSRSLKARS